MELDLRRDGPHAVVAGTTGSGKSELLQTWVASLALRHPPARLNFLLVDYKGGAAFGPCASLPHVVGLVTDLDDGLLDRVLTSLRAELRRREAVLARTGVKDVGELERRGGSETLPSLVIVVDEFASIVGDVAGFMEGMIDIARRGRSLGLHLVLATQRPAGVVSEHLLANTNLRIALRVADEHESRDVVGQEVAARIPRDRPGRAWVRLGGEGLVEVQTAYCGGRSLVPPDRGDDRRVVVRRFSLVDRGAVPSPALRSEVDAEGAGAPSDLEVIVEHVRRCAERSELSPPRRPWLPPLPARVAVTEPDEELGPLTVTIGLADDPATQAQFTLRHDLAAAPLFVLGRGPTVGRAISAMVAGAVVGRSPAAIHVDVIDGESGGCTALGGLPQVGTVIDVGDTERVTRLLRTLRDRLGRSVVDEPRRLLVIVDLPAFVARYEVIDAGSAVDALGSLLADGREAGVGIITTAARRLGLPARLGRCGARTVVMAADADDDAERGVARLLAGAPPGRCVVDGLAVQLADLDDAGSRSLGGLVLAEQRRWGATRAPSVRRLPDLIDSSTLPLRPASPGGTAAGSSWAPLLVGLDNDLAPTYVDLAVGNLLIAGPLRSGRSTALASLAAVVGRGTVDPAVSPTRRLLVAHRPSPWSVPDLWDEIAVGANALLLVRSTMAEVEHGGAPPTLVFVDDSTELDEELDAELGALARMSRTAEVRIVAAAESGPARRAYAGLVAELRRERRALLLQPDVDLDGDVAGVRLRRRSVDPVPPGRGELVERGRMSWVQVAVASGLVGCEPGPSEGPWSDGRSRGDDPHGTRRRLVVRSDHGRPPGRRGP